MKHHHQTTFVYFSMLKLFRYRKGFVTLPANIITLHSIIHNQSQVLYSTRKSIDTVGLPTEPTWQDEGVVAHKIPMTWTVYLLIYVEILGKSFGKFIWDFIGNLALIYINVWSGGRLRACQSRRKFSPQWWTPVTWTGIVKKDNNFIEYQCCFNKLSQSNTILILLNIMVPWTSKKNVSSRIEISFSWRNVFKFCLEALN